VPQLRISTINPTNRMNQVEQRSKLWSPQTQRQRERKNRETWEPGRKILERPTSEEEKKKMMKLQLPLVFV